MLSWIVEMIVIVAAIGARGGIVVSSIVEVVQVEGCGRSREEGLRERELVS